MLEIKYDGSKTTIIVSNPDPEETEIIERAKAVQAGIPYNPRRQTKEEIKSMFAKFRCNQNRGAENKPEEETKKENDTTVPQIPNIPDKYFAPAEASDDAVEEDDYPF